jgi:exosortase/archaeosortase family protein
MGLDTWISRLTKNRRALALVGLIVAFTGVSMVLNPTHSREMEWVGIPLLVAGFAILAWAAVPKSVERRLETQSLGSRLTYWLTWQGRLVRLFPAAGIGLIAADLAYNFLLSSSPDLLTEDIMVLLTAGVLLAYGFIPGRYSRERDFVFLFSICLDVLLIAPLLVVRLVAGNFNASVDVYSWAAIAPELSAILSLVGVVNSVHAVSGLTAPGLTFTPVRMATPVTLVISTACSGIYSFGIFASAYASFFLTEYERPSRRLWIILGLGFLASYAANLLRMVVIVLVGYYIDSAQTDLQYLLLAHSYAGWIIFLAWLALFWGLVFRFLPVQKSSTEATSPLEAAHRADGRACSICGGPLSAMIPAARCACGAIHHRACSNKTKVCASCGRSLATVFSRGAAYSASETARMSEASRAGPSALNSDETQVR